MCNNRHSALAYSFWQDPKIGPENLANLDQSQPRCIVAGRLPYVIRQFGTLITKNAYFLPLT